MAIKINNIILGVMCLLLMAIGYEIVTFPAEYIKVRQSALLLEQDLINANVARYTESLKRIRYEVDFYRSVMLSERMRIIDEVSGMSGLRRGRGQGYRYRPILEEAK